MKLLWHIVTLPSGWLVLGVISIVMLCAFCTLKLVTLRF